MSNQCIKCGASPCYYGFMQDSIECSNVACPHYSESLYPKVKEESQPVLTEKEQNTVESEDETDPEVRTPIWMWSNYHSDCGD